MDENKPQTSVKNMTRDVLHDLVHFDSKLFKTILPLLFKPGYLTEKTFSGEQAAYVKPVTLFVFLNFVFFIVKSNGLFQYPLSSFRITPFLNDIVIKKQAQLHIPLNILNERFNTAMHFEQKEYLVIMVPLFALVLQLLYIFKKRNYAENLVFSLHFYSFLILFLMVLPPVMLPVEWLWDKLNTGINLQTELALAAIILLVIFVYLFFGVRKIYQENFFKTLIKSALLSCTVILLIIYVYRMALFFIVMHSISVD